MLPLFMQVFRFSFVFYVAIAVLYTTNFLLVSPMRSGISMLLNHPISPQSLWSSVYLNSGKNRAEETRIDAPRIYNLNPKFFHFSGGNIEWSSSDFALKHGLGSPEPVLMDEELFLSKAFSNSMRPSKTIPYFYRASGNFDQDDITITTLVTSNRFNAFSRLVERYQGEYSL